MSRWEERKKERDAASKRSKTPYVAPEPIVQRGCRPKAWWRSS